MLTKNHQTFTPLSNLAKGTWNRSLKREATVRKQQSENSHHIPVGAVMSTDCVVLLLDRWRISISTEIPTFFSEPKTCSEDFNGETSRELHISSACFNSCFCSPLSCCTSDLPIADRNPDCSLTPCFPFGITVKEVLLCSCTPKDADSEPSLER